MPAPTFNLPIDTAHFLREHWQRKPLLIRNAIAGFAPPIDANELAGLAMEAEVESRIVEEAGGQWRLYHGPFQAGDFDRSGPWSLLVQAVDQYVPEVAALQQLASFVPQWRADDVMVSYASHGGSVGPHFDHYDVFLLQGEGQRRWRLGQQCDNRSPLLAGCDLRILTEFHSQQDYLLNPGDLLYVPPGLAHWGIAEGECTTFSIGFRAPSRGDLLARLTDGILNDAPARELVADPARQAAERAGEISRADIEQARRQALSLLEAAGDPSWLGELVTEPRYVVEGAEVNDGELAELFSGRALLWRDGASRLAWAEHQDRLYVFANGASAAFDYALQPWLQGLCASGQAPCKHLDASHPAAPELLTFLIENGAAYVE
ncbi:JmjC domain-containing protein [Parahaliea mediterranea]|uniref:JmjC domain-containing protein n=1 Tax=Parahaliea mediterranea TaxID=651086 RepID=UPI000E2F117A|nr:cupin domain-containing protein [Parahaliea mediterranea]